MSVQSLTALRRDTGAALCLECGKCSTLCPLTPFGGFSAARLLALSEPSQRQAGDAVERCLTCGSCEVRCPQGVRFTDFVLGLRRRQPAAGGSPCPHGELLAAAARLSGAVPPRRDTSWLRPDLEVAEEGEVALFVGCLPFFDTLFRHQLGIETAAIARAAVRALNHVGIAPVLVSDERCCGHDLLWRGDGEGFQALAEANAAAFAERGVKTVVTACAECCRTWRRDMAAAVPGYRPRVLHTVELLAERLAAAPAEEGAARPAAAAKGAEPASRSAAVAGAARTVTYHDPCRLGRHLGVVDAPRRLLDALPATRRREMEHAGADATCCGTPGFVRCDAVSRRLQSRRLAEAAATGAGTLLTACPKCLLHFSCAMEEDRRLGRPAPSLTLEDLTVYAARQLAAGDDEPAPGGAP